MMTPFGKESTTPLSKQSICHLMPGGKIPVLQHLVRVVRMPHLSLGHKEAAIENSTSGFFVGIGIYLSFFISSSFFQKQCCFTSCQITH